MSETKFFQPLVVKDYFISAGNDDKFRLSDNVQGQFLIKFQRRNSKVTKSKSEKNYIPLCNPPV